MITNTAGCTDARVLSFVTSKLTPSLSLKDSWHFLKQLQLVNDEPILIWRQQWSCNYAPYPFRDTITVCVIFNQTRDYKGPGLWPYMGISWQRKEKNSEWREPVGPRLAPLRHTWTLVPISGGICGFSQGKSFTIGWPSNLSLRSLCGWIGFSLQKIILLSLQAAPRRADTQSIALSMSINCVCVCVCVRLCVCV